MSPEVSAWLLGLLAVFLYLTPAGFLIGIARSWFWFAVACLAAAAAFWFLLPRWEMCAPLDYICGILIVLVEVAAFPIAPVCWVGLIAIAGIKAVVMTRG